ncbi:MAG: class I SAM-dependent methyltransferase [Nannocystaceae bacterium]
MTTSAPPPASGADAPGDPEALKRRVREHWDAEPCGTRGLAGEDLRAALRQQERERYAVDAHIPAFADFPRARGLRVLEIGVGAGTDFIQWLRAGADAWGVDLSPQSLALTRERIAAEGLALADEADEVDSSGAAEDPLRRRLQVADAERLPFADASFDLVYSYGVIHHSPDTAAAVAEIHRVLRPGGEARVMIYHVPSWTGLLLWGVHSAARLRPWQRPRAAIYRHLESPGTKAYTLNEARALFSAFAAVEVDTALLAGDLLAMRPSARYRGALARAAWRLYPRGLIRRFGRRLGLGLLVRARKAAAPDPSRG